jgi:hypothetical protein
MDNDWHIISNLTDNYELIHHNSSKILTLPLNPRPLKKPPPKPPIKSYKTITVQPVEIKR